MILELLIGFTYVLSCASCFISGFTIGRVRALAGRKGGHVTDYSEYDSSPDMAVYAIEELQQRIESLERELADLQLERSKDIASGAEMRVQYSVTSANLTLSEARCKELEEALEEATGHKPIWDKLDAVAEKLTELAEDAIKQHSALATEGDSPSVGHSMDCASRMPPVAVGNHLTTTMQPRLCNCDYLARVIAKGLATDGDDHGEKA